MTTSFTRAQFAAACRTYGPQVGPLPDGLDGPQLLWALGGVESSYGVNCIPRHEPAFDIGGRYAGGSPMPGLLHQYGSQAACSYGPLQVMLCNAPGFSPLNFSDINQAVRGSVLFLNSVLRHRNPQSLVEIGECWNTGSIRADPAYTDKLAVTYATPLPDEVQP